MSDTRSTPSGGLINDGQGQVLHSPFADNKQRCSAQCFQSARRYQDRVIAAAWSRPRTLELDGDVHPYLRPDVICYFRDSQVQTIIKSGNNGGVMPSLWLALKCSVKFSKKFVFIVLLDLNCNVYCTEIFSLKPTQFQKAVRWLCSSNSCLRSIIPRQSSNSTSYTT